jgi:rhodanese-related sulfurtransferase
MNRTIWILAFIFWAQSNVAQEATLLTTQTEIINLRANDFNKKLQEESTPQLIDIRTPREYNMGHIAGAININYYDPSFKDNIRKANLDTNKPIYIYCRSGNRSRNALNVFKALNFKKIIHLVYGINDWYRSGLPLTK